MTGLFTAIGLQRRILFLVGLALLVVLAVFAFLGLQAVDQAFQLVFSQHSAQAQGVAASLDREVSQSLLDLSTLAASGQIDPGDGELAREAGALTDFYGLWAHEDRGQLALVVLVDERGLPLAWEPHHLPQPASFQGPELQRALSSGHLVVEDLPTSLTGPLLMAAAPVFDRAGHVEAALVMEFTPKVAFAEKALSPDYRMEIVNSQGEIILAADARYPPGVLTEHSAVAMPFIDARSPGAAIHHMASADSSYKDHVVAYATLDTLPWGVVLEFPHGEALAIPYQLRDRFIALGFLALLSALGLAWITSRNVVKPIKALTQAAEHIAAGDLDHPVDVKAQDEVAILARALEDMRSRLKGSLAENEAWGRALEDRVHQRTKELLALHQASQELASTLDRETLLRIITARGRDLFPLAQAGAIYLSPAQGQPLRAEASFGFLSERLGKVALRPEEDCAGQAFDTHQPQVWDRRPLPAPLRACLTPENRALAQDGDETSLAVPLLHKSQALGSLALYAFRPVQHFTPADGQLLQSLANQAAISLANAQLFQEASQVGSLQELNHLKSELVARASHELRTPLTSIKSLAETLLRQDLALSSQEQREFLEAIDIAADRLARIITDLLTVSRIEAGRLEIRRQPLDLESLGQKVIRQFQSPQPERSFALAIPAHLPPALGDPDRLEDVLTNLLSNAVKYSPKKSLIMLRVIEEQGELVVSVIDQGPGIPLQEQDKLFQRFSRIGGQGGVGGVGLGLYISKSYVEAMGGRIWAESAPGQGSTFSFTLAVAPADQATSGALVGSKTAPSPPPTRPGGSVLVVDDEPDVLRVAGVNLKAQGFQPLLASTAREALELARRRRPDAIVLDIVLPDRDGFEVTRILKRRVSTRHIPIIFLSAKAQEQDEEQARQAGGVAFLKKPFSPRELCDVVAAAIRGSEVRATP
ncbi:MAG: response regulator [Chloroflexi bacterium]|nr:response regulator [Chloroflexota bacterium]